MKNVFVLFLVMLISVCFLLNMAESLTINQAARITAEGDGATYTGVRVIEQGTNKILSESWSPTKPSTNWRFKIYIPENMLLNVKRR